MNNKKTLNELINENDLLKLIDSEFNIQNKIDNEDITIEDVGDLLEKIEGLDNKGYDYIDIFDEGEYRVIPESIIEDVFYESVEQLVEDCYEIPENMKNYFDMDKFVDDCQMDGYGNHFNGYDGSEIEGNGFYLFRNN